MERHSAGSQGRDHPRTDASTPVAIAVAATIAGAGVAFFVTRAGIGALATTAMITSGVVGLLVIVALVAVDRFRHGDDREPADERPVPAGPAVDLDAELFRILDDARLADPSPHRQARGQDRRRPGGSRPKSTPVSNRRATRPG